MRTNKIEVEEGEMLSFLMTFNEWSYADVKEAVSIMKYWNVPFENVLSGAGQVIYETNDISDIDVTKMAYEVVLESIAKEFAQSIHDKEETYLCELIGVEGDYMTCSYKVFENGRWLKWVARHPKVPERVRKFLQEEVMIDEVVS